jgi:hypothetical protein
MPNLFYRRGRNGRWILSTIPTTRIERWRAQFDEGRGPLFWAAAVLVAFVLYVFLWVALAVGVLLEGGAR